MARTVDELARFIQRAGGTRFRRYLRTRGLARSIIWRNGSVPKGGPDFDDSLSTDLLSYGCALLESSLRLRALGGDEDSVLVGMRSAGEAIESVVRNGDSSAPDYGFNSVIAACAYHLARYSARAFSLLPSDLQNSNLTAGERALCFLIRRDLESARRACLGPLNETIGSDEQLLTHLENEDEDGNATIVLVLQGNYFKALARYIYALESGHLESYQHARERLAEGAQLAAEVGNVPLWWINSLTLALIDDLWSTCLYQQLPPDIPGRDHARWAGLRSEYIRELGRRKIAELELWPSQVAAVQQALTTDDNLVIALPTGAGKTRVAELAILRALAASTRCLYVSPLRALSAQLERLLGRTFGGLGFTVSSLYGAIGASLWDAADFRTADIVITTPEKLDYALRNDPGVLEGIGLIVLDEGHMIGLGQREIRYELLVQRLLRRADADERRLVCLSAMLPGGEDLGNFVDWISNGRTREAIESNWRPTRQRFGTVTPRGNRFRLDLTVGSESPFVPDFLRVLDPTPPRRRPFPNDEAELMLASTWKLSSEGNPVLVYCPLRSSVETLGRKVLELTSQGLIAARPCEGDEFREAWRVGSEWLGASHVVMRCLRLGVALHHGGLPKPFVIALEKLIASKALKVIISSPTLAQGVNITVNTIVFWSLYRNRKPLPIDEFLNACGRAGRAFVDLEGQLIFTVFGTTPASQRRLAAWRQLIGRTNDRQLSSGLVALVRSLLARLARVGYESMDDVAEYVLGMHILQETVEGPDGAEPVTEELRMLDEAILSLLGEDTDCTEAELADALDSILDGSLWTRQLARVEAKRSATYTALLQNRAAVIWRETTAQQRKAYHLSGLDIHAGLLLEQNYSYLLNCLIEAESAIVAGDELAAAQQIVAFATIVVESPYLSGGKTEDMPEQWQEILIRWLLGQSGASIVEALGDEAIDFIEDVLAFRLVWAMEAIRSKASSQDDAELTGVAAAAVETGTCSVTACLLLRAGLRSRTAAVTIAAEGALRLTTRQEVEGWLLSSQADATGVPWPTEDALTAWKEFREQYIRRDMWFADLSQYVAEVEWFAAAASPGAEVRLFQSDDGIGVYSVDLIALGRLTGEIPEPFYRSTIAVVSEDQRTVTL